MNAQESFVTKLRILLAVSLVCFVSSNAFSQNLSSTQVTAEISQIGDASHLEFSGSSNWKYDLKKEGNTIVLQAPKLNSTSLVKLRTYSDSLIKSVTVNEDGIDGGVEIRFNVKDGSIDTFDYLTDQPSSLVVDFYKPEKPVAQDADMDDVPATEPPVKTLPKKTAAKNSSKRKPASDYITVPGTEAQLAQATIDDKVEDAEAVEKDLRHGIFDGGDPEFKRFSIQDYEIKENAIIASKANIYLRFPMLKLDSPHLKTILNNQPVYEIVPTESQENKEARLLLTLFNNKRPSVFLKAAKHFLKTHPSGKYDEIVRYMMADVHYQFWLSEQRIEDLETALGIYRTLTERYPDSPLSTRTLLLVGYSYLDHGDAFGALKAFQRFTRSKPTSKAIDQVKISIGEAYLLINKYEDALAIFSEVEKSAANKKDAIEAAYRRGDVFFKKKDYANAVAEYKAAQNRYKGSAARFPNASFNLSESEFWLSRYKESLLSYRDFLQKFPDSDNGGYAMTRIGEILELMGADQKKAQGAYLESFFRYRATPGAQVGRIRLLAGKMPEMKEKELKNAVKEMDDILQAFKVMGDPGKVASTQKQVSEEADKSSENEEGKSNSALAPFLANRMTWKSEPLPEIEEFVTFLRTDGFFARKEHARATQELISYFQQNPNNSAPEKFKVRIARTIAAHIHTEVESGKFIEALRIKSQYTNSWLKHADRIDVNYDAGRAFEQAGVHKEAAKIYTDTLERLSKLQGTAQGKERNVFESLPDQNSVRLRLAAVAAKQKDYSKASEYLKSIPESSSLSEKEKIERAQTAVDVALAKGQKDIAKSYLETLVAAWKGQPRNLATVHYRLAKLQYDSKDYSAADQSLIQFMKVYDQSPAGEDIHAKALELNGDLQLSRGKRADSIKAYQKLLDLYESKRPLSSIRYKVGKIQFDDGDFKGAEATWSSLQDDGKGVWQKLAQEQLSGAKWQGDYKKYINRIPAMATDKKMKQAE